MGGAHPFTFGAASIVEIIGAKNRLNYVSVNCNYWIFNFFIAPPPFFA
jgi:hypothetical protein